MKKKKNKICIQQEQRHLAAQYRDEFFRKMKLIIDSVCGKDIYPLIPTSLLSEAYHYRCTPFKILVRYGCKVDSGYHKDIKAILPNLIKKQVLTLPPEDLEISLYDFYTIVLSIITFRVFFDDNSFLHADKVLAAFTKIAENEALGLKADEMLYHTLNSYGLIVTDLRKQLHWSQYEMVCQIEDMCRVENIIHIHSHAPEVISVHLDEGRRPAIRVGWPIANTGMTWSSIMPSVLGLKGFSDDQPLNVYIQSHALNRLIERIDCFCDGLNQFNIFNSLANPKITYDCNNKLLIEYDFFNTKAGYFRADVIDGIILLRTFLFVTNNGTPEGQLLEKNTGLKKLDKKYLNIDKLSTFMNSDLDQKPEVQLLFKKSGCQCLIDLYDNMKLLLTKKDNPFKFDLMLSYINKKNCDSYAECYETV